MRVTLTVPSPVVVHATCASCNRPADLECEGLSGYSAYPTYNEYFCPHCRKQNHARTPGAVLSVRAAQKPAVTPRAPAPLPPAARRA